MAKTRYTEQTGIEYKRTAAGFWRHIDTNEGRKSEVGPQYRTKAELLADHEDYLRRAGWLTTVESEEAPEYVPGRSREDDEDFIIARAIEIMQRRFAPGESMKSPAAVRQYLMLNETADSVEEFKVIWLDTQHRVIATETLSRGTINQATVYPREVVCAGLRHSAAACIISHNHPSGSTEASTADRQLTKRLKDALDLVDIRLLDHIITARGTSLSFAEAGMI